MTKRILALGVISIAVVFAQNAGRGGRGRSPAGTSRARNRKGTAALGVRREARPQLRAAEDALGRPRPAGHLAHQPSDRRTSYAADAAVEYGDRLYRTDKEFAALTARARGTGPVPDRDYPDRLMHQLSLIVDPKDGQFPELTEYGKKLQAEMKSSYKPGQTVFDAIEDFSAWDRCITRGMPVSMEPRNYNNGIRIMQSPGYVMILVEMAHEVRVVPIGMPPLDSEIKEWLGESRGHWEGNTLVVETKNFNGLVGHTSAGVPGSPGPLQPETPNMKITERFTRVAPDTIEFTMKVEDPTVLATGSYTVAYPMYLDNKYEMYEYSCHEGNTAVRNYIETSRFERTHPKAAEKK